MIGNNKKLFSAKTGMQKKQVLQDPGYVEDIKDGCCMLHALYNIMSETLKILKQDITGLLSLFISCQRHQKCVGITM